MDYLGILKKYWGYDSFRGIQEDIINSIGEGRDTLGLMPTGGGKSITFQVPALAKEGLCIVVTPLIALMKDQVANLKHRGIKATAVHAGMQRQEIITALENCIFGNYKFLYVSPERLGTDIFRVKLRSMNVNMITVDEAHCISQWGYDFRPAYLKIAEIRELLPDIPVLALTATATPEVVKDIQRRLGFKKENVFSMSFERKNLSYIVRNTKNKEKELLHILSKVDGSAIVYTRNRRTTKSVADLLCENGMTATYYHAGLDDSDKNERQRLWASGKIRVIVATNAFGMGIDKPDVRLVVHINIPDSPEAYFQEAGRAGRDGEKAYAVLLVYDRDKKTLDRRISMSYPEKGEIRKVYDDIQYYYQMAMGDGKGCTYPFDVNDFSIKFKYWPEMVEGSLNILTNAGYLEYSSDADDASRVMFVAPKEELYRFNEISEDAEKLIRYMLRMYTGLFSQYVYINEGVLGKRTNMLGKQVYDILVYLTKCRLIHYIPGRRLPAIVYTCERRDSSKLVFSKEVYDDRKQSYINRIRYMEEYAFSYTRCRSMMLLRYFGERNLDLCCKCDYCLSRHASGLKNSEADKIILAISNLLKESTDILPESLVDKIDYPVEKIKKVLNCMILEGKVSVREDETLALN